MANIKDNIKLILNEIKDVHTKSNFSNFSTPKLVAVSKNQDDNKIIEALGMGHKFFGENRVQEAEKRWKKKIRNI